MNNQIKLLTISLITLSLSAFLIWQGITPLFDNPESPSPSPTPEAVNTEVLGEVKESTQSADQSRGTLVTKVVDGDTIEVSINGAKQKVRYIGINTPETVDPRRAVECFGREASTENKRLVEGKEVVLKKDISDADKYGRLLRYVFVKLDDGSELFVNDYLVRQGFAYASSYPPDVSFSSRFYDAQKEARENNRGLWSLCK